MIIWGLLKFHSTLNMDVFSLNDPYFFHSFQLKKIPICISSLCQKVIKKSCSVFITQKETPIKRYLMKYYILVMVLEEGIMPPFSLTQFLRYDNCAVFPAALESINLRCCERHPRGLIKFISSQKDLRIMVEIGLVSRI